MADGVQATRFRFWLWLIRIVGVIMPRRLRRDWRQEWEAELRYRESLDSGPPGNQGRPAGRAPARMIT